MSKTVVLEEYAKRRSRRIGLVKKYGITALFLLPFITAFIVFFLIPLFYGIYISLTEFKFSSPGTATFNNFKWYRILFDNSFYVINKLGKPSYFLNYYNNFWNSFKNTLIFSVIIIPIAIILPLGMAIIINVKPPGFKLFRALVYLPSIIPLSTSAIIFKMIFDRQSNGGILANFFGLTSIEWFNHTTTLFGQQFDYSWVVIFCLCLWGGWGGNFLILSAGLQNVPKHLYEAAAIDGCSTWKRIMNITLPGIKPQLILCLFTTIIGYLGLYGQNFFLTSGGKGASTVPGGGSTATIMYYIQDLVDPNKTFNRENLQGLAAAASIVFALIVGAISGIQMYLTSEKKTGTKISEAYGKWQAIR